VDENNDLFSQVLRFNGHDICQRIAEYCISSITKMINTLGGLADESLVPRTFYNTLEGMAQQLSLFEASTEYDLDWSPRPLGFQKCSVANIEVVKTNQ